MAISFHNSKVIFLSDNLNSKAPQGRKGGVPDGINSTPVGDGLKTHIGGVRHLTTIFERTLQRRNRRFIFHFP